MDELIRRLTGQSAAATGVFDLPEVILALLLSFLLCLIFAYTYKQTHTGLSYSLSAVHTMIIMGVTVSVIMLIIGSNIARAFSLVGALSIIRFRTAIKDPRDVGFLFMTIAAGMACGTGFYLIGVVFTLMICVMIYFLSRFQIGARPTREVLLKIHLPEHADYHSVLNEVFFRYLSDHSLLSVESVRAGTMIELIYSVLLRDNADTARFLDDLRQVNGNNKVALVIGHENVNV